MTIQAEGLPVFASCQAVSPVCTVGLHGKHCSGPWKVMLAPEVAGVLAFIEKEAGAAGVRHPPSLPSSEIKGDGGAEKEQS